MSLFQQLEEERNRKEKLKIVVTIRNSKLAHFLQIITGTYLIVSCLVRGDTLFLFYRWCFRLNENCPYTTHLLSDFFLKHSIL